MVVLSVSAWEAFIEELVAEAVAAIKPTTGPLGTWSTLCASAKTQVGRFHNPTTENVEELVANTVGLQDVADQWRWKGCSNAVARKKLAAVLKLRHEIAHGSNPRPNVHATYARELPGFFRRLGACTDRAVRDYLEGELGIQSPWPT